MNIHLQSPVQLGTLGQDPAQLARSGAPNSPQRMKEVAHGFESLFVSQLIKEMRQTLEPDSMFGQDHGDILGGLFDQTMGQHLAGAGALGIARMLEKQWARTERGSSAVPPPAPLPPQRKFNTGSAIAPGVRLSAL